MHLRTKTRERIMSEAASTSTPSTPYSMYAPTTTEGASEAMTFTPKIVMSEDESTTAPTATEGVTEAPPPTPTTSTPEHESPAPTTSNPKTETTVMPEDVSTIAPATEGPRRRP
ncbi:hypothetical protein PF002_g32300 [Phytophthora fragariae]|uniref:Uncharacterized protein n=4 Tax=Phytophthora fragariae TaxID=53985 RepID=A0A6A3DAZ3_9STRA|nr:hypothetical protein PF003_g34320 [Phytophthora fragariae]KAE8918185.1 hypothetical protein PF009_g31499 [Phytophthora fragariae]KAE9161731.1 hypothetical protein PF002_g32300 [Phytophthora fragariae]